MTREELNKLKPGTRVSKEDLESVLKDKPKIPAGVPWGVYCPACGKEYRFHDIGSDIRTLVARVDRATGQLMPPEYRGTEVSCDCGTVNVKELLK